LKQWTNGALEAARKISTDINDESGIASTPYLTSALQIALSLAEQINKVEDNPEKLELLLVHGHQWGDCVRVQLEAPNHQLYHFCLELQLPPRARYNIQRPTCPACFQAVIVFVFNFLLRITA
jgi:hypothetical protein